MSAAAKTQAIAIPGGSTVRTTVSAKFLAKLQEQYEQGKFTDVCVRCVVLPEQQQQQGEEEKEEEREEQEEEEEEKEKEQQSSSGRKTRKRPAITTEPPRRSRRRSSNNQHKAREQEHTEEGDAQETENQGGSQGTTDILCHAIVLCARSPYFASSLSGDWNEAQTKTVKVVLDDDQAVQDMKLLIKLCYSGSYTKHGKELLDRSTRMRLAFLGNAFEMHECVSECLESLTEDLAPANVLSTLDEVPEELRGHEAMSGVSAKVIAVLADMRDKWTESDPPTASERKRKQEAANALGKALGPVDQLFDQGKWLKSRDTSFSTCLPLKLHVLALSPTVMEALLASDALHVRNENGVYTLLGCWVHQSQFGAAYDGIHPVSVTDCLPLFERLVKLVRFQHLSEFIGNIVTACPLANQSGLLPCILRSSLVTRHEF